MDQLLQTIKHHKQKKLSGQFIPRLHYAFKSKFGMSYDEFISLPIPTAFDLLILMEEEYKHTQQELDKIKNKK